jgi:hypothetical protein
MGRVLDWFTREQIGTTDKPGDWLQLPCPCCGTVTVPCCPAFPIPKNLTLTISITGGSCGGGLLPVSIPLVWDGTNWTSEHFSFFGVSGFRVKFGCFGDNSGLYVFLDPDDDPSGPNGNCIRACLVGPGLIVSCGIGPPLHWIGGGGFTDPECGCAGGTTFHYDVTE